MKRGSAFMSPVAVLFAAVLLAVLCACGAGARPPAAEVAEAAAPAATADAPPGVVAARQAVLDFLRDGANECVPPPQASWAAERVADPPAGYEVYRFLSGGCAMTITVAAGADGDPIYHVALGDGPTGFCWQAVVDDGGRILLTGDAAQSDPALGNPAQAYCEQQGYTFEVVTRASGQRCGLCVFEDGRACNAWAFFHGACGPGNAPRPGD